MIYPHKTDRQSLTKQSAPDLRINHTNKDKAVWEFTCYFPYTYLFVHPFINHLTRPPTPPSPGVSGEAGLPTPQAPSAPDLSPGPPAVDPSAPDVSGEAGLSAPRPPQPRPPSCRPLSPRRLRGGRPIRPPRPPQPRPPSCRPPQPPTSPVRQAYPLSCRPPQPCVSKSFRNEPSISTGRPASCQLYLNASQASDKRSCHR